MGARREHELILGDPLETGRGISQEVSVDGQHVGVFHPDSIGTTFLCDRRVFTLTSVVDPVAANAMRAAAPEAPEPENL